MEKELLEKHCSHHHSEVHSEADDHSDHSPLKEESSDGEQLLTGHDTRSQPLGFYFIIKGYANVVNPDDGFIAKRLKQGDYFGESDLLKSVGYSFFGDIIADSDDFECWYIS